MAKAIGYSLDRAYKMVTRKIPHRVFYKIRTGIDLPTGSEMVYRIYEQFNDFIPLPKMLVVDVGAQFGDYSIICNRMYGASVVAFEPLVENYKIMKKFIKKNHAEISIHNLGLSDSPGEQEFSYSGSMLSLANAGSKKQWIKFDTLDSFNLKPDIMKIDVEGYEMQVLKGAIHTLEENKPKVIIETHSSQLENQVRNFLGKLGYGRPREGPRSYSDTWTDSLTTLFFKA